MWLLLLAFCTARCSARAAGLLFDGVIVPLQGRRLAVGSTGTAPPARPTRSGRLYVSSPSGHVGDGRLAAPTARDLRRSIVGNDACRRNSRGHMATEGPWQSPRKSPNRRSSKSSTLLSLSWLLTRGSRAPSNRHAGHSMRSWHRRPHRAWGHPVVQPWTVCVVVGQR